MSECKQAKSHEQQIAELKDSRLPKTEREHAAVREIERLEQRLADVEEELDELDRELFIFAHDVMCFENDKMPDWVFEKAKAIYGRLCLGKGE